MSNAKKKIKSKKTVARGSSLKAPRRAQLASLRSPSTQFDDSAQTSMLVGLTDPFSSEAAKAKYPDQGSGRTLTYQNRWAFTMTASASGDIVFSINTKPSYMRLDGTVASSVATWSANYVGNFTTNLMCANAESYRPLTCGLRIINTLSATNSSGSFVLAKAGAPPLGLTTTLSPTNFTHWESHSNVHGGEWHTTAHPLTANAYALTSLSNFITTTAQDNSWENIYFYASGLPASSTPFMFELYTNYEYTPKEDSSLAQLATKQPVMSIPIQTAINHVQDTLPSSHIGGKEKVSATIKREAKKALLKHVLPFAVRKAEQFLV